MFLVDGLNFPLFVSFSSCLQRVISLGAVQVVVPGNFPIGCVPIFLTAFQTTNATAYDKNQCLKDLNEFAVFHNQYLKQAISILKKENPETKIVYADYYNAFLWLLENCSYLGKYKDPCYPTSLKTVLIRVSFRYL